MATESGIYEIKCLISGNNYIGSAVNFKNRWRVHRHHLCKGTHHSQHLQNAWNKYGKECFVFTVVEKITDTNELINKEQEWLDKLKPQYNTRIIADSMYGTIRTAEQRFAFSVAQKKASETRVPWNKGKTGIYSEETKIKIKEARARQIIVGYPRSEETKKLMSIIHLGKKMPTRTDEHKRKLSESLTGKKVSPEAKIHMSESRKGVKKPPRSEQHCKNISRAKTGVKRKPTSNETKVKLSIKTKEYWRKKHEQLHAKG